VFLPFEKELADVSVAVANPLAKKGASSVTPSSKTTAQKKSAKTSINCSALSGGSTLEGG
jgi:hypothetical protein